MSENEKKEKKITFKKILPIMGRIAFLIAILFLIVYLTTILSESKVFYKESAERNAIVKLEDDINAAEDLAEQHYENLYEVAAKLEKTTSLNEAKEVVGSYIGVEQFGDLRFYTTSGVGYTAQGSEIDKESSGDEEIKALVATGKRGCTDIYHDMQVSADCMAFFVPVQGTIVDGILSIVPVRNIISVTDLLGSHTAAVIIDENGSVYGARTAEGFAESVGSSIYSFVGKLSNDKEMQARISDAIGSDKKTACAIDSHKAQYVFAIAPIENLGGHFILIAMDESAGFIAPEMRFVRYIVNLTIIAVLALVIGLIYAMFYYRSSKQALETANYVDPVLGCPNAEDFRRLTASAVGDDRRRYAVAVFELRPYHYLSESLSEEELAETLKFVAKVIETFRAPRECYGYLGDGKFAVLISYNDESSIRDKVRLIEAVANKDTALAGKKAKKVFAVGVCLAFNLAKRLSAQELINHAIVACDAAKSNVTTPYVIYTDQVRNERNHDDQIELEMESALANNEFRLFLQPKYNVANDCIDSAEALVRWFDPKTGDYRFPGEFIGLFETNGFITKLDHFMYLEVLKNMTAAAEKGEKVVPISVNVSLVTASAPDFLDFYVDNKRKYQIPDNYITVEFTESFLMEDYRKLHDIVNRLHFNGIRCSLDDFGSGYASFSILKNIPFDEVKLDRMLLKPGFDSKHDETLLDSIIQLAKTLGMQVVQEGVETKELFDRVVEKGVEVIQGYYYAKGISAEEYKLFINSNTSIKYKSLVK